MLWIVSGCYLWAAIDLAYQQKLGLALVFICYAIANCGLIWASRS